MSKRERDIEKELVARVERLGGRAIKLTGYVGIPDRLVILPGRRVMFVELKSDTGKLSEAQKAWFQVLGDMDFYVFVIRDRDTLDHLIPEE